MANAQEIATWIIQGFDPTKSSTVERAIERVLVEHGCPSYEASLLAERKLVQILRIIKATRPESLPFEVSIDEKLLVGSQRVLQNDSDETRQVRDRLTATAPMLEAVYRCGNQVFEKVCARLMVLSGAEQAYALCTSDEGGIDVYGRIPLRLGDDRVRQGLLQTTLLEKQMLFLGQCKCYEPSKHIERSEVIDFHGAVDTCLNKYEGYQRKPSHRIPEDYYRTRELCIRVFFTTASFANGVESAANALDILCVSGRQIAEFLVYNQVGLTRTGSGSYKVDEQTLLLWAEGVAE